MFGLSTPTATFPTAQTPVFCAAGAIAAAGLGFAYYVDATNGDDLNRGYSPGTAWKTIAKVNAATFGPGDRILFKRGELWRGASLTVPADYLTFGAYGAGANPLLDETQDFISGWTQDGANNDWYRNTGTVGNPNQVFENGIRLTKVASQALVRTTAASFWWDASANIYVHCTGDTNPNGGANVISHPNAGTAAHNIMMNGKGWLVFDSIDTRNGKSSGFAMSEVSGAHDIVIRNCQSSFNVQHGFSMGGYTAYGHYNITFQNCIAHDNLGQGFWVGNGQDILVDRCTVYNAGLDSGKISVTNPGFSIIAGIRSVRVTVRGCNVYATAVGAGIMVEQEAGYAVPTDCVVSGNTVTHNSLLTGSSAAILIEGHNTLVKNNVVISNKNVNGGIQVAWVDTQPDSNRILNNTIWMSYTYAYCINLVRGTNTLVRNNLLYRSGNPSRGYISVAATGLTGADIEYNAYTQEGGSISWSWNGVEKTSFASWQTAVTGGDPHSTSGGNPDFVDVVAAAHLRILVGSIARNAGIAVGVTDDFDGNARPLGAGYDIGAYEYIE